MSERRYFVMCESNCKFESMTKEQILTAIEQAVSTGEITDVDSGFVTKLKEQNRNVGLKFWVGTEAEYNALSTPPADTFCIITDDDLREELRAMVNGVGEQILVIDGQIAALNADVAINKQNISMALSSITTVSSRVPAKLNNQLYSGSFLTNDNANVSVNGINSYSLVSLQLSVAGEASILFPDINALVYKVRTGGDFDYYKGNGVLWTGTGAEPDNISDMLPYEIEMTVYKNKNKVYSVLLNTDGKRQEGYYSLSDATFFVKKIVGVC